MDPILCVKGCGFFGSAENHNMCSKCYNDFLKTEIISKPIAAVDRPNDDKPASLPTPQITETTTSQNDDADVSELTSKTEGLAMEEKKNRCKCCKKKVGLLGFQCRCGGLFCGRHRMPELHTCEFDYKTSNGSKVSPHLVLVKADKLGQRV